MNKAITSLQVFVLLFLFINISFIYAQQFSGSSCVFKKNASVLSAIVKINGSTGLQLSNTFNGQSTESTQNTTCTPNPDIMVYSGIGDNIINSFKGDNLYLHLAGAVSTLLLVTTNTDYYVHRYFNEHEQYGTAARPVIRIATYFPFVISGSLYAYGKLNTDNEAVGASFAVLQSTVLAFTYNTLLKALTGRPNPRWREETDMKELSKTFRFGFWRGGIFWGWPSGHTSSTMAVVSALTSFYPEKTWLKIAGYGYTAYMIFSVSSLNRGGMHWFSDAVAAAFMSYAIGSTVGKYYRGRFSNEKTKGAEYTNSTGSFPGLNFMINL
ncbi:MAG: phosphatase PAP2 family protein [Bacillota bacterium]